MKEATRSAGLPVGLRRDAAASPSPGGALKRSFDVTAALAAIVFFSPLLAMLALLVKFSDGGSVLYAHTRIGRGGRSFRCLKFRTMVKNGSDVLAAHLDENPAARAEWNATRKLQDDPRVTRVGAVLRKLSLDELPQIFNVLRGEMSFVGPRPVVQDELAMYGVAAECYLRARPGLTGLWQVSGRNDVSYEKRVDFDRYYVENWSFGFDLLIIVKTLPAVIMSRGSY